MRYERNFYKKILDNLHDGVYFVDRELRITYWNRGAEELSGYKVFEVLGKKCSNNFLDHVDRSGNKLCFTNCPFIRTIKEGKKNELYTYFHHQYGYRVPSKLFISPIIDVNKKIVGAVGIFTDESYTEDLMQRIREFDKLSLVDTLTRMPNQRYLEGILKSKIDERKRYSWMFGLVLIDLDHFKKITELFGAAAGRESLKMVAQTIMNSLRSFDVAARMSNKEFAMIITNVNREQLEKVANRSKLLVENSFLDTEAGRLSVTVSVGATLVREDDTTDLIIDRAKRFLAMSKKAGGNTVTVDPEV